ncbi:Membrane protein involved in the export of O-antigen and teichoic acid [Aquimarina amphilecti]|uniref:Membrane protein involved in the export of O-antigen and teichoic acid n=1 Tax=Aquimarina amphilecti TaxID=1038014 RepID=A0A1H7JTD6_AQUAM|nr:oligosaccharide flippase family protein [Aquimarina amphilecti]SEK77853.1 Membrane protein involved in the export of O-antigen and teichoic acid [Aquimarina amphilecti]
MRFLHSAFLKNVLVLFSGNFLFQLINIFSLIFLSRYYTPSIIGQYAVFLSVNTIISTCGTGRLEMAIMLPKKNEEAFNVFISSFWIIVVISLSTGFGAFSLFISGVLSDRVYLVYILPISIFLSALSLLKIQFLNRLGKFKTISRGKIVSSSITAFIQILSIYYYKNIILIVVAFPFGLLFSNIYYYLELKGNLNGSLFSMENIKQTLKKYRKFPLINNTSSLFNIIANQGPVVLIEVVFGSSISGFYSVVQKTLNAPTSLIGMAFSQVYYKKIASESSEEKTKKFSRTTVKYFSLMSLPILVVIILFSDYLYTMVFGDAYIISSRMAKIMIIFFLIRLIVVSQNTLFIAKGRLMLDLKFNVLYAISVLSPILLADYLNYNWMTTIILITIFGTTTFLGLLYFILKNE